MFKRLAFFILSIACILPAYGANEVLELKVLNPQKKEVNPGDNINFMLEINNRSSVEKTVELELKSTNQNFKLLGDYSSIKIESNSKFKKIIGIKIPNNLAAGDFSISFVGKEKGLQEVFGEFQIPLVVNTKFEISLVKLKAPTYVLSGENINISYQLQNSSNVSVKILTTNICGTINQSEEKELAKDSSIIIKTAIKTEKKVQGYATQSIIFIAKIAGKPETETSIYTPIDVFPSEVIKFDKYVRFPVNVSTVIATSNRAGKAIISSMYDVQGTGTLGKDFNKTLDFHLRGPDRTGNPLFGMNEEYYLKYKAPKFSTNIGDYSFGLSELTESSRSGKGLEFNLFLDKFSFGAYYNLPRYYPLIKNVVAASTSFTLNPQNMLTVGLISKLDTLNKKNTLYSISGKISPFSGLSSENEFAFGQNNSNFTKAYKTSIQLNFSRIHSHVVYLYADPNFQGFVNNSNRLNFGSSIQLKKISFSFNYDMNSTNMALDTLYSNMPFSKSLNLSANYRIRSEKTLNSNQHSLSVSYNDVSLKDKSQNPLFDYTRRGGRLMIQSRIKSLNMSLVGDVGQMINKLDSNSLENTLAYSGSFMTFYALKDLYTINFFTSYQGGADKNVSGSSQFYYGCGFLANLKNKFSASLQYTSNYEWQYYTSDRSLLSMNLNAHLNSKNELNLSANYNLMKNTLDQKEYNVQLRYLYRLNLPIGHKKDLGSISGKIINHGIPKVDDIRLNLNGIVTMSDEEGNFRFPVVPVGNHILIVDASNLGINTTVEKSGPIQIKVEPGKVVQYDLPMTTTGRIYGRIVVQEDERSNQKGFIPVKENIEKLIVEVSNETQLFRIYTDKDGAFGFDDLLPGKWQLKIYPNGLPQGYSLVTSIYNINLEYGKREYIEVKIQKKARQIQFQKK